MSKSLERTIAYLEKAGICAKDPSNEVLYQSFAAAYDALKTNVWAALTSVQEGNAEKEEAYQAVIQQMKKLIHCLAPILREKEKQISHLSGSADETTKLREKLAQITTEFNEERIAWKNELKKLIEDWRITCASLEQAG